MINGARLYKQAVEPYKTTSSAEHSVGKHYYPDMKTVDKEADKVQVYRDANPKLFRKTDYKAGIHRPVKMYDKDYSGQPVKHSTYYEDTGRLEIAPQDDFDKVAPRDMAVNGLPAHGSYKGYTDKKGMRRSVEGHELNHAAGMREAEWAIPIGRRNSNKTPDSSTYSSILLDESDIKDHWGGGNGSTLPSVYPLTNKVEMRPTFSGLQQYFYNKYGTRAETPEQSKKMIDSIINLPKKKYDAYIDDIPAANFEAVRALNYAREAERWNKEADKQHIGDKYKNKYYESMQKLLPGYSYNQRGNMNKQALELDIDLGDVLLGGRYKNKREVVHTLGTDNLGQPTINGKKLLNFRIEKKLPVAKQSRKTREANKLDKAANMAILLNVVRKS